MTTTKGLLLDKYLAFANPNDWLLEEDLQDFIGVDFFLPNELGEYVLSGQVTSLEVQDETLKVNDSESYYDDFDFDFKDGVPEAVYALYIDVNAPEIEEPEVPEEPEEPEPEPETPTGP